MPSVQKSILFLCIVLTLAGVRTVCATPTYESGCGVCHGEGFGTPLHPAHEVQACTACHVDGPGALPIPTYTCATCHPQGDPGLCPIVDVHSPFSASCMDCHAQDCVTQAECDLFIKYKKIRADKLRKPRKRALRITGSEGFDPFGERDLGPLTLRKVFFRKNKLKAVTTVPAGLEPQIIPIRVGDCLGEIEIQ